MMKVLLVAVVGLILVGCGPEKPDDKNSFVIEGKKITITGHIKSGSNVTVDRAKTVLKLSVNMLEKTSR